jgi:Carboxypeptidase regulatory-like domain/TonB dependent receptor
MTRTLCRCALLLCLSFISIHLYAQNATITGEVQDSQGAVIRGAEVRIVEQSQGTTRTVHTNETGNYNAPFLNPGPYRVYVQAPAFSTAVSDSITLTVGQTLVFNVRLKIGSTQQEVTVDAGSQLLNTTDASVSTVVDQKFVANMPLNGRSFQDLISMTPGVVTQSPQNNEQAPGTLGDFSVNGQRTESNYYTVDGVTANISSGNGGAVGGASTGGSLGGSTALGTTQTLISVDALQEFRVESSTYSAEYGHSPGGQFALVTRSGTNVLHGTVFDYLRNGFFDANDWFNDHYGDPQPALRQNDFGGTLGGPVRIPKLYSGKDRTFFFASYEGLRLDQPTAAAIQYVPDLFMRQQATAAMQPILNAFPLPNGIDYGSAANPSLAQFIEPFSLPSAIDSTSLRVDHIISPKLSLFFRFGDTPSSSVSRPYFARDTTISNATTYTLGVISQLSHRLTDEFRLGYARSNSSIIGALDNFGGATPIDLAAAMGAGLYQKVEPAITFDITGIGAPAMLLYDSSSVGRQWNVVDTISLSEGRHTLKFGVDYRHIKSPISPATEEPYAIFETTQHILAGTPEAPYVFSYLPSTPIFDQTALFAQDEWRVHSRLSLSLGLRWEINPPPTEQHGNDAYTLLGNINDPSTLSVAPRGTPLWDTTWYNFAPRLGMAWTAHDQPGRETVVRAGGGVFFDSANEVAALGYNGLGFEAYQLLNGAQLPFTASQLDVPITVTPPYTSAVITAFPEHLQLPYTLEWNTSIQQALGKNQAFTISYVGSNGRRLIGEQELSLTSFNPNFGEVVYFPNGITSNYQALQTQFQRTVARGIQALASYTWSHSIDFGSSTFELPLQRGNSDFDVRNNLQGGISWDLPTIDRAALVNILSNGWGLDARLNVRSAFPVTPQGNEFIDPATGSISNGELNLVAGQPIYVYGNQYPGGKAINPAAFSLPATGISGDAPRNFVRGFGATQLNMAARREFHLHHDLVLKFRAEAFNILNHPNFGYVDPLYTDATFGQATETLNSSLGTVASQYQQGGPRSMQFALKLHF